MEKIACKKHFILKKRALADKGFKRPGETTSRTYFSSLLLRTTYPKTNFLLHHTFNNPGTLDYFMPTSAICNSNCTRSLL